MKARSKKLNFYSDRIEVRIEGFQIGKLLDAAARSGMQQLADLIFQCFLIIRIAVPQRTHRNACAEIQIFVAVYIIQPHALAVIQHHRETIIRVEHHLLRPALIFTALHDSIFPPLRLK